MGTGKRQATLIELFGQRLRSLASEKATCLNQIAAAGSHERIAEFLGFVKEALRVRQFVPAELRSAHQRQNRDVGFRLIAPDCLAFEELEDVGKKTLLQNCFRFEVPELASPLRRGTEVMGVGARGLLSTLCQITME